MSFKVGTSKVDITPNYNSPTRRWYLNNEDSRLKTFHSQLYARTSALSLGDRIITITSMEVACLYKIHYDHIKKLTREMLPFPVDEIILHNTHQHSDSFIEYEPDYDQFELNDDAFDLDYIRSLPKKIASSIILTAQGLEPARFGHASGEVSEGIASCRRFLMDNGELGWRASRPEQELREIPRGHIDPEVGVATFSDLKGKPLATLFNYACHPSAAGGDSPSCCSADYAGFAAENIEQSHGGIGIFFHGCSGDINPGHYVRGDALATEDRIADARRMGKILSDEVVKVISHIKPEEVRHLQSVQKEFPLPVQPEASDRENALRVANDAVADWRKNGSDPRTALRKYIISKKLVDNAFPGTVSAVSINDLGLAFIPGESFTAYGEHIKARSTTKQTLVASTCGEDPFYMPTPEAVQQGGYESGYIATSDTGQTLANAALDLLTEVARK